MALTAELKRRGGERADVSVRARAFIPDWLKKRKKRKKNIYEPDVLLFVGASGLPSPIPNNTKLLALGIFPRPSSWDYFVGT